MHWQPNYNMIKKKKIFSQKLSIQIISAAFLQTHDFKMHQATSSRQTAFLPQMSHQIILIAFKYKPTLSKNVLSTGVDEFLHQWKATHWSKICISMSMTKQAKLALTGLFSVDIIHITPELFPIKEIKFDVRTTWIL